MFYTESSTYITTTYIYMHVFPLSFVAFLLLIGINYKITNWWKTLVLDSSKEICFEDYSINIHAFPCCVLSGMEYKTPESRCQQGGNNTKGLFSTNKDNFLKIHKIIKFFFLQYSFIRGKELFISPININSNGYLP